LEFIRGLSEQYCPDVKVDLSHGVSLRNYPSTDMAPLFSRVTTARQIVALHQMVTANALMAKATSLEELVLEFQHDALPYIMAFYENRSPFEG
jgi:hypothetical protein